MISYILGSTIGKTVLLLLLSWIIYSIYSLIIFPFIYWRKYKKYSNVISNPSFIPLLGDMKEHLDNMNAGKVHYSHLISNSEVN